MKEINRFAGLMLLETVVRASCLLASFISLACLLFSLFSFYFLSFIIYITSIWRAIPSFYTAVYSSSRIMANKLKTKYRTYLGEQYGFSKERSCTDSYFTLKLLIDNIGNSTEKFTSRL